MKYSIALQQLNIVWVAPLSPYLFTPLWFENYDLLRKEDIDKAEVVMNNNSIFIDFGWVEINATVNKIVFRLTKSGLEMALSDLVKSVITLLDNVATIAIGINANFVYNFPNKQDWHKIGDALLPKDIWKENNQSKLLSESDGYHFGMKKIVLEIAKDKPHSESIFREKINLTINSQPDLEIENLDYGLQLHYNHDLKCLDEKSGVVFTKLIPTLLDEHVKNSTSHDISTNESLFNRILS